MHSRPCFSTNTLRHESQERIFFTGVFPSSTDPANPGELFAKLRRLVFLTGFNQHIIQATENSRGRSMSFIDNQCFRIAAKVTYILGIDAYQICIYRFCFLVIVLVIHVNPDDP